MNNHYFNVIKQILTMGLLFILIHGCGGSPQSSQVKLHAEPSKTQYAAGETVKIKLTLENTGQTSTAINRLNTGTIRIKSLTRNGAAVSMRQSIIDFEDDLASVLERSLESVSPGGRLLMWLKSSKDRNFGGQALSTITYSGSDAHIENIYDISRAGDYKLTLVYQYPGPNGAFANVFTSETNEVSISFTIQ